MPPAAEEAVLGGLLRVVDTGRDLATGNDEMRSRKVGRPACSEVRRAKGRRRVSAHGGAVQGGLMRCEDGADAGMIGWLPPFAG